VDREGRISGKEKTQKRKTGFKTTSAGLKEKRSTRPPSRKRKVKKNKCRKRGPEKRKPQAQKRRSQKSPPSRRRMKTVCGYSKEKKDGKHPA